MKTSETNTSASIDRESGTAEKFLSPAAFISRYEGDGPSIGTAANWRSEAIRTGVNPGPPFVRVGGKIFYPLSGVVAWENRRTIR
jgi:hypothetical protein